MANNVIMTVNMGAKVLLFFYINRFPVLENACCHLPPICHHQKSPCVWGFEECWWQSGSNFRKNYLYYENYM